MNPCFGTAGLWWLKMKQWLALLLGRVILGVWEIIPVHSKYVQLLLLMSGAATPAAGSPTNLDPDDDESRLPCTDELALRLAPLPRQAVASERTSASRRKDGSADSAANFCATWGLQGFLSITSPRFGCEAENGVGGGGGGGGAEQFEVAAT